MSPIKVNTFVRTHTAWEGGLGGQIFLFFISCLTLRVPQLVYAINRDMAPRRFALNQFALTGYTVGSTNSIAMNFNSLYMRALELRYCACGIVQPSHIFHDIK